MVLATADGAGAPWATPVWFATEDGRNLYWVSSPETRHSRNLAARPQVGIAIFDSTQAPGTGKGVYLSAMAAEWRRTSSTPASRSSRRPGWPSASRRGLSMTSRRPRSIGSIARPPSSVSSSTTTTSGSRCRSSSLPTGQQLKTNQHRSLRSRWSSSTRSESHPGADHAANDIPGGRPGRSRPWARPPVPPGSRKPRHRARGPRHGPPPRPDLPRLRAPWSPNQVPGRGVCMAGRRASLGHRGLTTRPCATEIDRVSRTVVIGLGLLEVVEHVLRAVGRPDREEVMIVVLEAPAATGGDEPGIRTFGRIIGGQSKSKIPRPAENWRTSPHRRQIWRTSLWLVIPQRESIRPCCCRTPCRRTAGTSAAASRLPRRVPRSCGCSPACRQSVPRPTRAL